MWFTLSNPIFRINTIISKKFCEVSLFFQFKMLFSIISRHISLPKRVCLFDTLFAQKRRPGVRCTCRKRIWLFFKQKSHEKTETTQTPLNHNVFRVILKFWRQGVRDVSRKYLIWVIWCNLLKKFENRHKFENKGNFSRFFGVESGVDDFSCWF